MVPLPDTDKRALIALRCEATSECRFVSSYFAEGGIVFDSSVHVTKMKF